MATLKKKFYLGVEGGGTKSTAMLVDEDDDIIMQRIGKALNYHSEGKESAKNNISSWAGAIGMAVTPWKNCKEEWIEIVKKLLSSWL